MNKDTKKGLNILIVEDDPVDRKQLARLLTESSLCIAQVQSADCLKESVSLLDTHSFDIILSDLGLPDGSGMDSVNTFQ